MQINGATPLARARQVVIAARTPRIGRVQRQIRRAFIAHHYRPLTTIELMRWCYPKVTKFKRWHSYGVRRAAPKFAVAIGRRRCTGYPVIWAPKMYAGCQLVAK